MVHSAAILYDILFWENCVSIKFIWCILTLFETYARWLLRDRPGSASELIPFIFNCIEYFELGYFLIVRTIWVCVWTEIISSSFMSRLVGAHPSHHWPSFFIAFWGSLLFWLSRKSCGPGPTRPTRRYASEGNIGLAIDIYLKCHITWVLIFRHITTVLQT